LKQKGLCMQVRENRFSARRRWATLIVILGFANLKATIPQALEIIAASIFILLFLMTGSILVPLKAIVINLLSLTATFGALVWIFQQGHFQEWLNFQSLGSIDGTQPVLIFATAFGLSMDYEVFLLSRIKEEYDASGNNQLAVATGLQRTGGMITSAALLLAVVLGAFSTSHIIFIKEVGVGLAIAVLMDASIIRTLLVPATMRLLGRANWWAPMPLKALWRLVGLSEAANDEEPAGGQVQGMALNGQTLGMAFNALAAGVALKMLCGRELKRAGWRFALSDRYRWNHTDRGKPCPYAGAGACVGSR
jgi:uncharacterized membrane protein YdfJ with MMPL/SSD domain